jgi:hypothetical protein
MADEVLDFLYNRHFAGIGSTFALPSTISPIATIRVADKTMSVSVVQQSFRSLV